MAPLLVRARHRKSKVSWADKHIWASMSAQKRKKPLTFTCPPRPSFWFMPLLLPMATTATTWLLAARSPFPCGWKAGTKPENRSTMIIRMERDNTKSRMPLQRGRILSIEAIQAVQSLKRAKPQEINQVLNFKFLRLLKRDMVAVLRELLRQNNCLLALMVFEEIRKELWYRPQVSLYAEMVTVFANNGFFEEVELLCSYLNSERDFLPELEGFNTLFRSLVRFRLVGLVMECYKLMRSLGGEPDRSLYRILINGVESTGERWQSCIVRRDAQKDFGESLEFLEEEEEEEEMTLSRPLLELE